MPRTADRARRAAAMSATVRSAASRAATGSAATASPARSYSSTSRPARSSSGAANPIAEVGQPLADQALRRVDQQDRGLEAAEAVDEDRLLPRVLEVVARVRLVGDRVDERGGADGQVRVDVDPRAAPAVEPVVARPRLVADERDPQVLAVRQPERSSRRAPGTAPPASPAPRAAGPSRSRTGGPTRRGGRSAPRRRGGAPSMAAAASSNSPSGRRGGRYAKQRVTWSRYGSASPASAAACVSSATSWASSQARRSASATSAASRSRRSAASSRSRGRCAALLHVDPGLELGRAEVAVDEPGDVLVEPEGEQEVVACDRIGRRHRPRPAHRRHAGAGRRSAARRTRQASPAPKPPVSPANGMCWRSTASRLIRRAAVFCSATSRT